MTVFSGSPKLFTSLDPNIKKPNQTHHDKNSLGQGAVGGSKSKALYFSSHAIQKASPACKTLGISGGSTETDDPCALFATVYCENDCKYSLRVHYDNAGPQQLLAGTPQHGVVRNGNFNYYYLIVRESKILKNNMQIYSMLNSMSGNADLYVQLKSNPYKTSPEQWQDSLPTSTDYLIKSAEVLGQDVIKLSPSQLKECFDEYDASITNEKERSCAIIYGVYAPSANQVPIN